MITNDSKIRSSDALFNVFYSNDNGFSYASILGGHKQPTDYEYLDISGASSRFWAVAATGWGDHDSYLQGIEVTAAQIPAPATLAILGLALAGLSISRKKSKVS